ncbi:type II secretion system protein [Candidatus Margulisiibacteriota bacterium]
MEYFPKQTKKGYFLIEVVVAIAIFSTLILFSSVFFQQFFKVQRKALAINQKVLEAQNAFERILAGEEVQSVKKDDYDFQMQKFTFEIDKNKKLELLK